MKKQVIAGILISSMLLGGCVLRLPSAKETEAEETKHGVEILLDKYKEAQEDKKKENESKSQVGSDKTIKIKKVKDLQKFASRVADGEEGLNASLEADLDLSAICGESKGSWEAIHDYNGTFDGQGHSISNLYITGDSKGGMFYTTKNDCVIKNLNLTDVQIDVNGNAGSVAVECIGTIENCTSSGTVKGSGDGVSVGGIVGVGAFITDCSNQASVECYGVENSRKKPLAGGIAGTVKKDITGCANQGTVTADQGYIGGVAGYMWEGQLQERIVISDCYNTGAVKSNDRAGGVVGSVDGSLIDRCYNLGFVEGGTYAGGVLGDYVEDAIVINSFNRGDVSCKSETYEDHLFAGGVAGDGVYIANCYSQGTVSVSRSGDWFKGSVAGGIIGGINSRRIFNSYSTARLDAKSGSEHDQNRGVGCALDQCSNVFFLNGTEDESDRVGIAGKGYLPSQVTAGQFTDGTILTELQNGWNGGAAMTGAENLESELAHYNRSLSDMSGWKAGADGTPGFDWEA